MTEAAEEWRPVDGMSDYEVSSLGRARSLSRIIPNGKGSTCRLNGRVLKPGFDRYGYERINLYPRGGSHAGVIPGYVHRLVCQAFHGPPPPGRNDAAHKDGNCRNNTPENLYWASRSENNLDAVRHGRNANTRKTHCPQGHPLSGDNIYPTRRACRICANARAAAHHERARKAKGVDR